jgi:zinc D-Ala-D-Ala dipeptidase
MDSRNHCENPIPFVNHFSWENTKKVCIRESGEKLVAVSMIPERIIVRPQYFIQGIEGALPECYIRESAYDKLLKATQSLPKGYKFLIYDAWRPQRVQNALYHKLRDEIIKKVPARNEEEISCLVEKYVALPSDNHKSPSPHLTGGSVDLTIINEKGKELEMGTKFDETKEEAHSDYFERIAQKRELTEKEKEILENRRLLYHTLICAGFTNYPCEWWHYDFGNQVWAYLSNLKSAFYGVSFPELRWKHDF